MSNVGAGPGLTTVLDYLNKQLPSSYAGYLNWKFSGAQATFNYYLDYDVRHYQPMVFTMSNPTTATTYWPYKTNGHFVTVNGLITWESNKYFVGDPYYFQKGKDKYGNEVTYVSGATANNGEHKRTWAQMAQVSKNLHGSGNECVGW
jgi:hypothetical protein